MQPPADAGRGDRQPAPAGGLAASYRVLLRLEAFFCFTALIVGTLALLADIVGRELFGIGVFGAQRLAVYCMAVAGMLGFSYVVSQGGHVRVSIVDRIVPARFEQVAQRAADLVSAVVCAGLALGAFLFVRGSYELGEYSMTLPMAVWTVQSVLPIAFALAALKYLLFAAVPGLASREGSADL